MQITKIQAIGNDFVFLDGRTPAAHGDLNAAARFLCDRHFGVGADGLVVVSPAEHADARMRIFNPDGTEAEMCGNALRSTGLFARASGLVASTSMTIETIGGRKEVELVSGSDGELLTIRAQVNAPDLRPAHVPVLADGDRFLDRPIEAAGRTFTSSAMSMGNPHCVSFIEDVAGFDLETYGAAMERHPLFPERVNAEFAEVLDRSHLAMRVYERSVGETLACGTGSCVAVVAGFLTGRNDARAEVRQPGGVIGVEFDPDAGTLTMIGPSTIVFTAELPEPLPAPRGR